MKVAGIIAEYNPFHSGHKYNLQKIREVTGAQSIVCVMSGNFVQRGEPAIINKWARTKMALLEGADLVFELPAVFAVSSAPNFSFAAVNILHSTGIVDYLCFGSEDGEIYPLYIIAEILENEPPLVSKLIKQSLKLGYSYPRAQAEAVSYYFSQNNYKYPYHDCLNKPNNLLGINYIRSLIKLGSKIKPIAIKRVGSGYHETDFKSGFASATGIRKKIALQTDCLESYLKKTIPPASLSILLECFHQGTGPVKLENFTQLILGLLRRTPQEQLALLPDVIEGFESRLKKIADQCENLEHLLEGLKTKRYTWTRIQRTLIHLILDIKKGYHQLDYIPYLRVLGFNNRGRQLLKQIKKQSAAPIIISVADQIKDWKKQQTETVVQNSLKIIQKDILATDLYMLGVPKEKYRKTGADFYYKPVIIKD